MEQQAHHGWFIGGTAAAVAAGILPVGRHRWRCSIRIPPSAHCGLFGLKPSRGRASGAGFADGAIGLSVGHVISRSVRDSALLLDVGAGPEFGSRVRPGSDVQAAI